MQSIIQPSTLAGAVLEWLGLAVLGLCVLVACDPGSFELLETLARREPVVEHLSLDLTAEPVVREPGLAR